MTSVRHPLEAIDKILRADAGYFMSLVGLDAGVLEQRSEPGFKKYVISLAVSDVQMAGTLQSLTIAITGTLGRSGDVTVNHPLIDPLSRATMVTHALDLPDVGDPLTIDVELGSLVVGDALHLGYIALVDTVAKAVTLFPGHRWVTGRATLRKGAATLASQETHQTLIEQRQQELSERQRVYGWGRNPRYRGFPGYLDAERHDDLPLDAQFADMRSHNIPVNVAKAAVNFGLKSLLKVRDHFARFHDFVDITNGMDTQGDDRLLLTYIYNNWTRDDEFGRQYLNGHNPTVLRKCAVWPTSLSKQAVVDRLAGNVDVDAEMKEGRLYVADYSILDDLHKESDSGRATGDYCAPVCLLRAVPSSGALLPIVIQLRQRPGEDNPVWTARDGLGWLLAKIYVRSADAQVHELDAHLLRTHLVVETFAVATWRQLPTAHPVHKLVAPHVRSTVAINAKARETLLNDGGVVERTLAVGGGGAYELVRRAYRRFSMSELHFPASLRARGVDDAAALPGYHYRDDGLRLWAALAQYAGSVLGAFYASDADVAADAELQAWIGELRAEGFASWDGGGDEASRGGGDEAHGVPRALDTKEQLVDLVTAILFAGSAAHAAVNFSQMAYYGFVPNAPMLMRRPPPTDRRAVTLEVLRQSLPWQSDAVNQLLIAYVLTRYSESETFIGNYREIHFTEEAALDALTQLRLQLDQLAAEIEMRNKMLGTRGEVGYSYMSPRLVPNAIAI